MSEIKPPPYDHAAFLRQCAAWQRHRNRPHAHDVMNADRGMLVYRFARLVEELTGRHVTPKFFYHVTEAMRSLKRPSETEVRKYAERSDRNSRRLEAEAEERARQLAAN